MKRFFLGMVVGIILVPAALILYLTSGHAPAATADAPLPFERLIAKTALHAKIRKEMPTSVPMEANEAAYLAGARVYRENCSMCHGLPGQAAPAAAKGMFPPPPQLLQKDEMVTDDPPGETFWKAKNGIRLTGMPGFGSSLSTQQMWQVSLLLANADKLPDSVQQALASPSTAAQASK
jgi:mono/diheme cytochrome c family protein